jgi:hypothetical protein
MNFSKRILNWAAWVTLIATYLLPYQSTDGFATKFGYPFSFLTVYDAPINTSLSASLSLNPLTLAIDVMIFYFIIKHAYKLFEKIKPNKVNSIEKNAK